MAGDGRFIDSYGGEEWRRLDTGSEGRLTVRGLEMVRGGITEGYGSSHVALLGNRSWIES